MKEVLIHKLGNRNPDRTRCGVDLWEFPRVETTDTVKRITCKKCLRYLQLDKDYSKRMLIAQKRRGLKKIEKDIKTVRKEGLEKLEEDIKRAKEK